MSRDCMQLCTHAEDQKGVGVSTPVPVDAASWRMQRNEIDTHVPVQRRACLISGETDVGISL